MPRVLKFDLLAKRLSEQSSVPEESALVFSTKPYPVEVVEELGTSLSLGWARLWTPPGEELDIVLTLDSAVLRALLNSYDHWPPEGLDFSLTLQTATLRALQRTYSDWPAESIDVSLTLTGGNLRTILFSYPHWPAESIDVSLSITGANLT